jgi:hypothetical protein
MSPVGFRCFFFVVDDGPSGGVDDDDDDTRAARCLRDRLAGTTAVQRVGWVVVSGIVF